MDNSDAGKCPLCNGENACAMAAGQPPQSCWCQQLVIAPEALAALPEAEKGRRCICKSCALGPKGAHH